MAQANALHKPLRSAAKRRPQPLDTYEARDVRLALIMFWALLLPAGLALKFGDIVIPPYRLVAIGMAPFALISMAKRHLRFVLPDYLIILGGIYGVLASFMSLPLERSVQFGGSFAIDTLGTFFIGRAYLTTPARLRLFLSKALPGVILIGAILAFESISHRLVIAPFFPTRGTMINLYEVRMGLLRARATFPHSIAAGFFMTSMLPLYYLSGLEFRKRWTGVAMSLFAVFTVSSSAFLTLLLTAFFLAYKAFFNFVLRQREKMYYLLGAFAAVWVALDAFTGRGAARTFIQYFALNVSSGYYRIQIWTYGTASVANHMWFGIGDGRMARARWMIVETIDNHWLMVAVRYGLPTAVLIGAGIVAGIWRCGVRSRELNIRDQGTTMGAILALTTSGVVAWTAALWANNIAWFMMIAGAVFAMSDHKIIRPRLVAATGSAPPLTGRTRVMTERVG